MNIVKELGSVRRKLAKLEAKRQDDLRQLAPSLGFASTEELIGALQDTLQSGSKPAAARKKRVVITKRIESSVANYAQRKWTGARIAKKLGISIPSVQNIKKRLGLVKGRK